MKVQLTESDKESLKEIYTLTKKNPATIKDLETIETLLKKATAIAEKYGKHQNDLLQGLSETARQQLDHAKKLPVRNRGKWQAIADLKLHLMGDLIGWF